MRLVLDTNILLAAVMRDSVDTGDPVWTEDKVLLEAEQVPTRSTSEIAERLGYP